MIEEWKDVAGYEGHYMVSNNGVLKTLSRIIKWYTGSDYQISERIIKGSNHPRGYMSIHLALNGAHSMRLVHRVVAIAFIPNPENYPCVNHIDGNKKNNNVSNLEWCTHKQNTDHAIRIGLYRSKKTG